MVNIIRSCALLGLEVHPIVCEVDLSAQLPSLALIGLPSSLTQESRERVRAAVVNSGFDWPARKITVNLLPADLPKWGCHFELAMALGVLGAAAEGRLCPPNVVAIGELSLSGLVRPCGWLPAAARWLASASMLSRETLGDALVLIVHEDDARQLRASAPWVSEHFEIAAVTSLRDAENFMGELAGRTSVVTSGRPRPVPRPDWLSASGPVGSGLATLTKVEGEPLATVAALVGIAGRHHCLFAGPHGVGKSMLVRAMCEGALTNSAAEISERDTLRSLFGESFEPIQSRRLKTSPQVVRLQTSATRAALEGAVLATGQVLPGELTRAHHGILVADELLECRRDVIEAFRQPLDEGLIRVQRAKFRTVLPARFQLLATTNLCPCGEYGRRPKRCGCTARVALDYQRRLSGPLMDRFDIAVMVGDQRKDALQAPADVAPLLDDLARSELWAERLARFEPRFEETVSDEPDSARIWSQVACDASPRGRLKLGRVSRTIARLLGQPRSSSHLRLALVLREELRRVLLLERLKISSYGGSPVETIN